MTTACKLSTYSLCVNVSTWSVAVTMITEVCGTLTFLPHALLNGFNLMNPAGKLSIYSSVSPKCQSARGMQWHSNKIKQEFGLTDFPKASFRVNAGTKRPSLVPRPCYMPPFGLIDVLGCNNYVVM